MNKWPWLRVIGSTVAMLLGAGSCWAHSGPNEHAGGEAHRIAKGDRTQDRQLVRAVNAFNVKDRIGFGVSLPMCLLEHRGEGQSLFAHFEKYQGGGSVDDASDPLGAVGGLTLAQRLDVDRYAAGDGGFKGQQQTFVGRSNTPVAVRGEQGLGQSEVANKVSDRRGGDNQRGNRPKVPEIDAGAGSGALALLVGGLLLAAEKRRRSF